MTLGIALVLGILLVAVLRAWRRLEPRASKLRLGEVLRRRGSPLPRSRCPAASPAKRWPTSICAAVSG